MAGCQSPAQLLRSIMGKGRHLRGSTQKCPKCGSRKVAVDMAMTHSGYGPGIAVCENCRTIWEPFDPAQIWDTSDAHCSFKEPCNNCAFRPGSNEQEDRAEWIKLIGSLKAGASFYCHKGVPIEPDAEHGFAYPTKTAHSDIAGPSAPHKAPDIRRLRLCRGYLNALQGFWRSSQRKTENGKSAPEDHGLSRPVSG